MYIEKLASAIKNDVVSGLRGYHQNLSLNIEQLQDEIVACRLSIIKQYALKGIFPIEDLLMSINCINIDCESLERCPCNKSSDSTIAHFEIPQIVTDYGELAINYIGSTDRKYRFNIVMSLFEFNTIKYRKRGSKRPYVWIDLSPNKNGMLDCFVFNAPLLKQVSVVAIFKDPRQLDQYDCCKDEDASLGADTNLSFIDELVRDKLTKEKLYYYRQLAAQPLPNDQQYVTGG